MRITLPSQKRPIDDILDDEESEVDFQREKSHRSDDFQEAPMPSETQFSLDDPYPNATSTAAAADSSPSEDQHPVLEVNGVVLEYFQTCLTAILDYYLRQYRSSRYELRRRSVSLTVLENHRTRGTFPGDLDFKLGVANPYRNIHANRDELLKREQQIVQEAKSKILDCRIEAAASAVLEQEQMIESKFFANEIGLFGDYARSKINPFLQVQLVGEGHALRAMWNDNLTLYSIKIAEQKGTLDAKFAALDAKRADGLKKTAKSVPLVNTLNESDFQSKFLQALKSLVEEHTKRPRKKPAAQSTAPSPPSPPSPPPPASDSGKGKRKNRRKAQKQQPPTAEKPAQTKTDTSKRRSYSSVTSSAPPAAPPAAPPSSKPAPRPAKPTSSSSHRSVSFTDDDMSVEENDDTWTQVRHHKNRRSGKNAQAQDNRDVPKQTQVRLR